MSPAKRVVEDSTAEELVSSERRAQPVAERDDFVDVPAAVVCALCGDPDCPGCSEERSRSGVISIVVWERPGSALARLWATAKASTQSAEAFFESLPDGEIAPALRFALIAEAAASAAMLLGLGAVFWLALVAIGAAPSVASIVFAGRVMFAAVLGLTVLLVAAHATHGYALDLGARAAGGVRAPRRALRFGLYAAGWDLMLGPIGFLGLLMRDGPGPAFGLMGAVARLPTRCSVAFLRGAYSIQGDRAKPALRLAVVGVVLSTILCALVIIAVIGAALLR